MHGYNTIEAQIYYPKSMVEAQITVHYTLLVEHSNNVTGTTYCLDFIPVISLYGRMQQVL